MSKIYLTIDSMPGGHGGYDLSGGSKANKLMKKIVKKTMKSLKVKKTRAIASICNTLAITGNAYTDYIEDLETESLGFKGIQVKITFCSYQDFYDFMNEVG
jgi:hypothetical protein